MDLDWDKTFEDAFVIDVDVADLKTEFKLKTFSCLANEGLC